MCHDAETGAADGHQIIRRIGTGGTAIGREPADRMRCLPKEPKCLPLHRLEQFLIGQCGEIGWAEAAVFHDLGLAAATGAGAEAGAGIWARAFSFLAVGSMIKCKTLVKK